MLNEKFEIKSDELSAVERIKKEIAELEEKKAAGVTEVEEGRFENGAFNVAPRNIDEMLEEAKKVLEEMESNNVDEA